MVRRSSEHRYQLGFDFTREPEEPVPEQTIYDGTLSNFDNREPKLGRFIRSVDYDESVQTPSIAANFLMREVFVPFDDFTQEELTVLALNTRNRITHTALIYRGTIDAIHVRTAEIFRPAILVNARSIMLAHVHPSGEASPSQADETFTQCCVEAGRILDTPVLDHIVVGRDQWVSLRERGQAYWTSK